MKSKRLGILIAEQRLIVEPDEFCEPVPPVVYNDQRFEVRKAGPVAPSVEEIGPIIINPSAVFAMLGHSSPQVSRIYPSEALKKEKIQALKKAIHEAVEAGVSDQEIREAYWSEAVNAVMQE